MLVDLIHHGTILSPDLRVCHCEAFIAPIRREAVAISTSHQTHLAENPPIGWGTRGVIPNTLHSQNGLERGRILTNPRELLPFGQVDNT